jgi:hypothetical protein
MDENQVIAILTDLAALSADQGKINKFWNDLLSLEDRLAGFREKLAGLRPDAKDYDGKTHELAVVVNAIESQVVSAQTALDNEIRHCRLAALASSNDKAGSFRAEIRVVDEKIIGHLISAREEIKARYGVTDRACELMDKLALIAHDYKEEAPTFRSVLPWTSAAIPAFGETVKKYISRFAVMASQGEPPPGDLVDWFSTRTEYQSN